jgi:head-tail adaptor
MRFIEHLRQPIEIQAATQTKDATGGFTLDWAKVQNTVAIIEQKSSGSRFDNSAYGSETVYSFKVRMVNRQPEVKPKFRVIYANETYQIEGVKVIGRNMYELEGVKITV